MTFEVVGVMERREPRVYYLAEREDRKAILVFDGGYVGGDIHIYEHKESRPTKEIEEEVKAYFKVDKLSSEVMKNIVGMWIEQNFGHSISWKLTTPE